MRWVIYCTVTTHGQSDREQLYVWECENSHIDFVPSWKSRFSHRTTFLSTFGPKAKKKLCLSIENDNFESQFYPRAPSSKRERERGELSLKSEVCVRATKSPNVAFSFRCPPHLHVGFVPNKREKVRHLSWQILTDVRCVYFLLFLELFRNWKLLSKFEFWLMLKRNIKAP